MHRLVVAATFVMAVASQVHAATFFVDNAGDTPDAIAGDGVCGIGPGMCTLRAAIQEANSTAAADTINFAIPGGLPHVIQPASALPTITAPLTIDAGTPVGGVPNVKLDGSAHVGMDGLFVQLGASVGCQITGLTFTAFNSGIHLFSGACTITASTFVGDVNGIEVATDASGVVIGGPNAGDRNVIIGNNVGVSLDSGFPDGVAITNNLIGVDRDGVTASANASYGIVVGSGTNHVISGNTISASPTGIYVGPVVFGVQITGNHIGTDQVGFSALGNGNGIIVNGAVNTLVQSNTIAANVSAILVQNTSSNTTIASNLVGVSSIGEGAAGLGNSVGITVQSGSTGTAITGNTICNTATDAIAINDASTTGTTIASNTIGIDLSNVAQGNSRGIRFTTAGSTLVGGSGSAGNTIANSINEGITGTGTGLRFLHNSIHDNGQMGIDLAGAGVTPNGTGSQDFPVVAAATRYLSTTFVRGTLHGPASSTLTVEVFANAACDSSGYGEGQTLIGAASVGTDAAGTANFLIPASPLSNGTPITTTATATDTSEFSACTNTTACADVTVAPDVVSGALVGTVYSQAFTANGVTTGFTFTTTGTPPPGLTMASDGVFSGTPTTPGNYTFTVVATDQNGCGGTMQISMQVCPVIAIDPTTIADGSMATAYNIPFAASGGTGPYTYAFTGGQTIPGLTLNASTGAYTGTPTSFGSFMFTLRATDASSCTGARQYTVNISLCDVVVHPTELPAPSTGVPYDAMLSTLSAATPVTYAITSGTLPAGLSLADDHISGTPTTRGTASFTIQGTAADGCVGSRAYDVTTMCGALTISPSTIETGTEGEEYSVQFSAAGGSPPYTFTTGGLPDGLSLSSSGAISGTPTNGSGQLIAVFVSDAMGCMNMALFTLTIDPAQEGCCGTSRETRSTSALMSLLVILCLRRRARRGATLQG